MTGPADVDATSCTYADQSALDAAFATWIGTFAVTESGCGILSQTDLSSLSAPDICTGGIVNVTFEANDKCTNDSYTAHFEITPAAAVSVTGPADVDATSCTYADQSALDAAFATWIGTFAVTESGCGILSQTDLSSLSAPDICTGGIVNVTFEANDKCTNDSYTAHFEITPAGDFTMPANGSSTVACASEITMPTPPTVTDNCGAEITPTYVGVSATPSCEGTVVYTWNYEDCSGFDHDWTYAYMIAANNPPSILTLPGALDIEIQCKDAEGLNYALSLAPEATSSCGFDVTRNLVSDDVVSEMSCSNAYIRTRTWNFTDDCGNVSGNFVQVISVVDSEAPVVLTSVNTLDRTYNCDNITDINDALMLMPEATDNCSSVLTPILTSEDVNPPASCDHSYTIQRVWNFVDECGNTSSSFIQLITIVSDIEAIYEVEPSQNIDNYTNGETLATVSDADGAIISAVVISGTLPAGTIIDPVTGEITVDDQSSLIAGTYSFEVTTVDSEGGVTTQTVTIVIGADIEAVYVVEPAQNVDSYTNGETLATVSDADGEIVSATVTSGTLPAGTIIDPVTGEITVGDQSSLIAGTYSFEVTTVDSEGGVTTQTVTIVIGADIEAVYVVEPAQNVDSYTNGETLATVSDADGEIVSATVTSDTLPAGTVIDPVTGEITVGDESSLIAGTFSFEVTTVDSEGGVTTQTVTIVINPDIEAVYTVEEPNHVDYYNENDILASVFDEDGDIVFVEILNGEIPEGVQIDLVNGLITVLNPNLLIPGSYRLTLLTTDILGGQTEHVVTLTFDDYSFTDTDGDGVSDIIEVNNGNDPLDPCSPQQPIGYTGYNAENLIWATSDCDGDGVSNYREVVEGTDPFNLCDLILSSVEFDQSMEWLTSDCDGDGVTNQRELTDNTSVFDVCEYNNESIEVTQREEWMYADCDGDGVTNRLEQLDVTNNFDPCDFVQTSIDIEPSLEWTTSDCDGDGVTNGDELKDLTILLDGCSLSLESITLEPSLEWNTSDCDNDGILNGQEMIDGPDSDDGIPTRIELSDLNGNGIDDYLEIINVIVNNDTLQVGFDLYGELDILVNDVNIFGNNDIEIVYQTSNGTININQSTGVVTYYPNTDFAGVDSFAYSICNTYGQCGQAVVYLYVEEIILPPQIFTPNDNGQNDYFEINNIEKYDNVSLIVFNRWGNKVYESNNYMNDWDGYANVSGVFGNKPLPVGTYFYVLNYGENRSVTGFVYLKR